MSRSLYGKLALVLLFLFCAVGVLYTLLMVFTTRMYQQEVNQKLNRALARNIVTDQLLQPRRGESVRSERTVSPTYGYQSEH